MTGLFFAQKSAQIGHCEDQQHLSRAKSKGYPSLREAAEPKRAVFFI
jgi:hypothetical protein